MNILSVYFFFLIYICRLRLSFGGGEREGGVFLLALLLDLESCPLKPKTFLKIYEWKKQTVCVFSRRGEVTRKYLRRCFALDSRDVIKFWRNAIEEMVAR